MPTDGRTEGKIVIGVTSGCKGVSIFNMEENKMQ